MPTTWDQNLEAMDAVEVNWGAGTILAIFFAASLISACFFGLGYSFGRGGTPTPDGKTLSDVHAPAAEAAPLSSLYSRNSSGTAIATVHPAAALASANRSTLAAVASAKGLAPIPIQTRAKIVVPQSDRERYMVQVGAVGTRKDAKTLISHLRKRGFHAGTYESKRDKFLHVQIGPFATAEQAQAVRHHVLASGFRAILKRAS